MSQRPALLCAAAIVALTLAGCSGGPEDPDPSTESPSSSTSEATSSASPSETATPSQAVTPSQDPGTAAPLQTSAPTAAPTGAEPAEPPLPAAPGAPAADGASDMSADAQAFFAAGGVCNSDTFPSGMPSPELVAELQAICATQTDGLVGFPQQDGDGTMDADGYQRPAPDADGYVGPSEEYYAYGGYVEPGFEYQVGSECFDADLGRCKTSGELQTEYQEGAEVEDLMRERGVPLPSEQ